MADAGSMVVRELLIAFGVKADNGALAGFEKQVDGTKKAMVKADERAKKYKESLETLKHTAKGEAAEAQKALAAATAKAELADKKAAAAAEKHREVLAKVADESRRAQFAALAGAVGQVRDRLRMAAHEAVIFGAAVAGVGYGLVRAATSTAEYGEEAARLATGLGTSIRAAQELRYVFERAGADSDDLSDALGTLADRAEDAKAGTASMIEDFALIGLSVEDLRGADPEELFLRFADAVAETEDVNKRVASTVRILGDDVGRKLLPVLRQGRAGIAQTRAEAHRLGVVMDDEAVAASRRLREEWYTLGQVLVGVRNDIGLELMPSITRFVRRVKDWYRSVKPALEQLGGWRTLLTGLAVGVGLLGGALAGFRGLTVLTSLVQVLMTLAPVVTALGSAGGLAALAAAAGPAAIAVAILVAALAQLAWMGALVGGLVLTFEDLSHWLRGAPSLMGRFEAALRDFGPVGRAYADYLAELRGLFWDLTDAAGHFGGFVVQFLLTRVEQLSWMFAYFRDQVLRVVDAVVGLQRLAALGLLAGQEGQRIGAGAIQSVGADRVSGIRSGVQAFNDLFATPAVTPPGARGSVSNTNNAVNVVVNGASDPAAVAREVRREIEASLGQQARLVRENALGGDR